MIFTFSVIFSTEDDAYVLTLAFGETEIEFPLTREEVWTMGKTMVAATEPGTSRALIDGGSDEPTRILRTECGTDRISASGK